MISATEIIIIIAGFLAVILGFILPVGTTKDGNYQGDSNVKDKVNKEIENSRNKIDNMVEASTDEAVEKTERALDRITNEKISAINEYYETVMGDIHRNHEEVMFMYDMLNDKHKNLKNTFSEVSKKANEAKEAAKEAQDIVRNAPAEIERKAYHNTSDNKTDKTASDDGFMTYAEYRRAEVEAARARVFSKRPSTEKADVIDDIDLEDKIIEQTEIETEEVVKPRKPEIPERTVAASELRDSDWSEILKKNVAKERAFSAASIEDDNRRDTLQEQSLKQIVKDQEDDYTEPEIVESKEEIISEETKTDKKSKSIFAPLEMAAAKKVAESENANIIGSEKPLSDSLKETLKEELVNEIKETAKKADEEDKILLNASKVPDNIPLDVDENGREIPAGALVQMTLADYEQQINNAEDKGAKAENKENQVAAESETAAGTDDGYLDDLDGIEIEDIGASKPAENTTPVNSNSAGNKTNTDKVNTENTVTAKVVNINEAHRNESKKKESIDEPDPMSQNRRILEMHKAGKSNMVIARELGLGIGEVKLVVDLSTKHKRKKHG